MTEPRTALAIETPGPLAAAPAAAPEAPGRRDYAALIRPHEVHGSLYTSPEIFAEELARI